eukprot:TRINITY_DN14311_c0_g1_i3.p1 TRINITY_DN14311_c0_g1~~TRINITY_DN14311_c0_g1_i3.p1  ORF type:complete len:269 (+),score=49.95 TRINITY_DN14311_c0_g1_i3:56-808(+)
MAPLLSLSGQPRQLSRHIVHPKTTKSLTRNLRVQRLQVVIRAQEQSSEESQKSKEEDDFEARLAALKTAKNQTPYGQGKKAQKRKAAKAGQTEVEYKSTEAPEKKVTYDFSGETVYFEGGPHVGDLITNVVMGATLVWLPLTIASVTRAAFVKYRFTDKRFTVSTQAPWQQEESDIAYQQVKEVATVSRGLGLWGDMVVTLADNSKVELRSIPQHQELKQYILDRRDALLGTAENLEEESSVSSGGKGFM